ncbi:alpha-L-rhamnosidase N-terminal domain-containing protein [Paenibacillus sp. N3.4]|uniref:alpha-L-rhamnosidase N-terminal domain-containing protein n=1 Tax=Paenibacillus sp. N3.4 TaxID=2603222 RepID=UPI0021C2D710|nr:alpha-L-rhamnosidase N-terminal domain-containing protein [Paenibacillus sp. N3.4]
MVHIEAATQPLERVKQEFVEWQAQWIWNDGEASPRNEWHCFRKSFEVPADGWGAARILITADSRYALYVNGTKVGRGPVRSWPFEQSYDTYEIADLLRKGHRNTVAVLVQHFGVSNFYYLRGRGGLLVQIESESDGRFIDEQITDESWKTSLHLGYDRRSGRMACQQGFAERMDARDWSADWHKPDFDDSTWSQASLVGSVGSEPWSTLVPRDIPLLTEELIWPVRVEALKKVKPVAWTASLDIRNQMVPESVNHANPIGFVGYVATVIRMERAGKAMLGFLQAGCFRGCSVNGEWLDADQYTGVLPERYAEVDLKLGDNFILIETTGVEHGRALQMGVNCDHHLKSFRL